MSAFLLMIQLIYHPVTCAHNTGGDVERIVMQEVKAPSVAVCEKARTNHVVEMFESVDGHLFIVETECKQEI
jgi:hypothetical protein